jgi:hypothetical protein
MIKPMIAAREDYLKITRNRRKNLLMALRASLGNSEEHPTKSRMPLCAITVATKKHRWRWPFSQ